MKISDFTDIWCFFSSKQKGRSTPVAQARRVDYWSWFRSNSVVFTLALIVFLAVDSKQGNLTAQTQNLESIHFGIQSTEGATRALENWKPLIAELNDAAEQQDMPYRFTMQPQSTDELRTNFASGDIDILFSDPSTFIWAQVNNSARPLLSSASMWEGEAVERGGAVFFTRTDQTDIRKLSDLRGRKLMAVDAVGFQGWQLAYNEFKIRSIDPDEFLSSLLFSNGNQREVVYAVQTGLVDVGLVGTGVLERLAKDGIIERENYAVVSEKTYPRFPFAVSTGLYPNWVLSSRAGVPEPALATIIETLLKTQPDSEAAKAAGDVVWQAPQNYEPVRNLLIYLRAAPYENYFLAAAIRIYQTYRTYILIGVVVILASFGFLTYELRRNLRLIELSRDVLASEERSRKFYRNAVEEHTVFCMLNKEGEISYVNRQFCETTDYGRNDLLSRSFANLLHGSQKKLLENEISAHIKSGSPWNGSLQLLRSDDTVAWAQCTIIPVTKTGNELSEIAVVASDVTQTCAGVSTESFHDSLELISDQVIVLLPKNLEILYCNKAAEQQFLTSCRDGNWKGECLSTFVSSEEFEAFELRRDSLLEGKVRRMVWDIETESGTPYEVSLEYVQPENNEPRLVAIYRDLSERRAADKAKTEFVSTISHELRTPLTSMKGALGLALNDAVCETPDKVNKLVKMASDNCDRLVLLIDDILDLSKIDANKMEYAMKPINLETVVASAVASNQFYADKFGITIKTEIGGDPDGYFVNADSNRITQILDNLLSNAAKFSPKGGEVIVSLGIRCGNVHLSIKDFGSGIPERAHAKIFDKFTQVDSSDTRSRGGTGLGLAIVKIIAEAHNGMVWFDSAEDQGTEFFVDLPRLINGVAVPLVKSQEAGTQENRSVDVVSNREIDGPVQLSGTVQGLVKHMRDKQISATLKQGQVTSNQIANGNGMVGQTNILNWISSDAKSAVTKLLDSKILANVDVFTITSEMSSDVLKGDKSQLSIESRVLRDWLLEIGKNSGMPLNILGIGNAIDLNKKGLDFTQVDDLEQGIVLAEQSDFDLILHSSDARSTSKIAIIPTVGGVLSGKLPLIVVEMRKIASDTELGVVAKFAHPASSRRGKARRQKAAS
jgi:PAS domain S-box-containing protein